jgi:hypothetical protein
MSISSKAQAKVIKKKVTPIILYASDQTLTKDVIEDYKKVITYTQDWYKYWLGGKTFACHDIVKIKSVRNSKEWIRLHKLANPLYPETRWTLWETSMEEIVKVYPDVPAVGSITLPMENPGPLAPGQTLPPRKQVPRAASDKEEIYLTLIYAGDLKDASELPWYSTAASRYTTIEPQNTAAVAKEPRVKFSPKNVPPIGPKMARFVHLLAHELGHSFGLNHTCDDYKYLPYPTCDTDFMQYGMPPYAIMIPQEANTLRGNTKWIY